MQGYFRKQNCIENLVKVKKYCLENRDRRKDSYLDNRDRIKEYQFKNHDKIESRQIIHSNNRYKTDNNFSLICKTRSRLQQALRGKVKSSSTIIILGIDNETYRNWIEYQMTWYELHKLWDRSCKPNLFIWCN